jgi:uncharacterized membrane protein (UPF0136 family)
MTMLAYLFVLLGIAMRFMPHPWTFTPLAASLLFFGARGSRRTIWVPLVLLVISDVVLTKYFWGYHMTWDQGVIWAWYAAVLLLGTRLTKHLKPLPILGAAVASSVSFFVISNFAVWAATDLYPKTFAGLMTSYSLAIPFFRHGIEGDLLFTAAMFATPVILHALSSVFSGEDHAAAA